MKEQINYKEGIIRFLKGRFALDEDNEKQEEVEESIRRGVEFRGPKLWVLIFAIIMASVGLNVNSQPVIIGAMLISPLMGPIMGFGLSLGIYDFELLKRSLRNLLFAIVIGLLSSTVYFLISPLSLAQSELLARTSPTIWDVLIAFLGGLAGIIAQTRTDRISTVIPGVAIATALMPPLCTAGYGLATMQLSYCIGALYLFTINTVLISVATYLVVRFLNYEKKQQIDSALERKVRNYIYAVITITVVPSVILGYNIVLETLFESNSKNFITQSFKFPNTQVVDYKIKYSKDEKSIEVLLLGSKLSDDAITSLEGQLEQHNLEDAKLILNEQGTQESSAATTQSVEKLYNVSSRLLDEKDKRIAELSLLVNQYSKDTLDSRAISKELSALTAGVVNMALSKMPIHNSKGQAVDSMLICVLQSPNTEFSLSDDSRTRITSWLKVRTNSKNVQIIEQIIEPYI